MKFQPPRGTRDFLPEEMARRNYIIEKIRKTFESFGFQPLDTPAFESWEVLSAKGGGGDEIKDEIYYFRDKSDRELGLRFDLTVPLARVVANNPNLQLPFKRYQIGKVWRYDKPQAGRMREFLQMDPDIVGTDRMEADTECIAAAVEALKGLGFKKLTVRLNNRKMLNGMLEFVNIPAAISKDVLRVLDKIEKISENEVTGELKKIGVESQKISRLMKLIDIRGTPSKTLPEISKLLKGVKPAEDGLKELAEIASLAKSYGIGQYIVVDMSLVRGLDYYTGPIFEITIQTRQNVGSVAGGGRYDSLIELFGGRRTLATGISFGIERIFEVMKSDNMFRAPENNTKVFVISVNDMVKKEAIKIAQELRRNGVNTETELMGRNLGKQLEYANRKQIPFALIVGPKEMKSGKFTLRDMKTGKEIRMGLDKIINKLKY